MDGDQRVVTFLLLDVEGSTRRWEDDPTQAAADIGRFDAIVGEVVHACGGTLVRARGEGDSHFVVFDDPIAAGACAAAMQYAFHVEAWPGGPLRVRAALHVGMVQAREGSFYGRVVNRCARLRALAAGGQTLLSDDIAAVVAEAMPPNTTLVDHGKHRLKDLEVPEHVWELRHDLLPADFPPLPSLSAARHNLPVQTTSFRGRDTDVAQIAESLWQDRLVTLTGAGGIGKTRLAQHVAAEVTADLPDGAWLVELAGITDPDLVPLAVATALGIRTPPDRSTRDVVLESLPDQTALLVLDNCEHLLDASADLADALLRGGSALRILATSREALGVPGERRISVPPLDLDGDVHSGAPPVAVRLFLDRSTGVRADLDLRDPAVLEAATQICRAVAGLPLGIELAAARTAHLTVEEIADRVGGQMSLLSDRRRHDRHATLRAAIGWSHELLDDEERCLFRRLAVFPDSFLLEAAEAVAAGPVPAVEDVLDVLARLVDCSLVTADLDGPRARYRLLQPIRAYACEMVEAAGEAEHAHRALVGWLARHVARNRNDITALAAEIESIRTALEVDPTVAAVGEDHEVLVRLATDLIELWVQRLPTEGAVRLDQLLAGVTTPSRAVAAACNALGELRREHDVPAASVLHARALAIATELGDRPGQLRARIGLGAATRLVHGNEHAVPLLESALAVARADGDDQAVAGAAVVLALALSRSAELDRSASLLREGHRLYSALGQHGLAAEAVVGLASLIEMRQGRFDSAQVLLEGALQQADATGYRQLAVRAAVNLGRALMGLGAPQSARMQLEEALHRAQVLGNLTSQAWCTAMLGELARDVGDLAAAEAHYTASIVLFDRIGNTDNQRLLRCNLAHLALAAGRYAEAEATGLVLLTGAETSNAHEMMEFVELVGEARATAPRLAAEAARLLGAAARRREELGIPREQADQADYDVAVDRVRAVLGPAADATLAGVDRPVFDEVVSMLLAYGSRLEPVGLSAPGAPTVDV